MSVKKYLIFGVTIFLSFSVLAQELEEFQYEEDSTPIEQESLIKAPENVVKAATEQCQSWAKEDEVEEAELAAYLLDCVNEQLLDQGYKAVSTISQ